MFGILAGFVGFVSLINLILGLWNFELDNVPGTTSTGLYNVSSLSVFFEPCIANKKRASKTSGVDVTTANKM